MKGVFKKRFSIAEMIGLLIIVVSSVTTIGYAVTTVPYIFTANTKAKADEVNTNFQALADAIDNMQNTPDQVRDKFFTGTSCTGNDDADEMVKVGPLCVDKYEASVWNSSQAAIATTQYGVDGDNYQCSDSGNDCIGAKAIYARSIIRVTPSRYITWFQAQQACANSGKRLLTNAEWQMAAAGTVDPGENNGLTNTKCNTYSNGIRTTGNAGGTSGGTDSCISNWGIEDMAGNISEWVTDWIQGPHGNGTLNNWEPDPFGSSYRASATYGEDFLIGINEASSTTDPFPAAIVRGGGYFSGTGAGVFA